MASVEGAVVDALVIVAPAAVRSRCVVEEDAGAAMGGVLGAGFAATRAGGALLFGAVDVAATWGAVVVVAMGAEDGAEGCGFVTVGGETPAFRRGGVDAATASAGAVDVVVVVVRAFVGADETIGFFAVTGGADAVIDDVVAVCVVADMAGAGFGAWRFCHQFPPPACQPTRRREGN